MRTPARLAVALLAALIAYPAWASDPAGNAVAVVQQATAKLDGTSQLLDTGAAVYMGQQVITGKQGQVQVVFKDNTHLVVGPGSTLVISQYLMRDSGTANKFVINALSGTFRFVTGNSQKSAYQINTPTGTLAVRGTAFDFGIDLKTKQTNVLLYHGRVGMCDLRGACVWMSDACSVGVLPAGQPGVLHGNDYRRPPILGSFPYLASQDPLRQDFRVPGGSNCSTPATALELPVKYQAPVVPSLPPAPPEPSCGDGHDCDHPPGPPPGDEHSHDGAHDGPHEGTHDAPHDGPHDGPHEGPHDGPHHGPHDRPR